MSETWLLPRVERTSTIEQVHRTLRDAIIEGEIPEGARWGKCDSPGCSEPAAARFARRSGTSSRRASSRPSSIGARPSRRCRSATTTTCMPHARPSKVWAATWLVESGEDVDLSPLEEAMEELRAAAVGEDRPTEAVIAADVRFHRELVALTGSPRLARAYETLAAETRMLLRHHPPYPWQTYVSDHEILFEALSARDSRAPELVAEHLRLSSDLIGGEISGIGRAPVAADTR